MKVGSALLCLVVLGPRVSGQVAKVSTIVEFDSFTSSFDGF